MILIHFWRIIALDDSVYQELTNINKKLDRLRETSEETSKKVGIMCERLKAHVENQIIHQVPPCDASMNEFKRVRQSIAEIQSRTFKILIALLSATIGGLIAVFLWVFENANEIL